MQNKATDLFSSWAKKGKDEGMAEAHSPAVNKILDRILVGRESDFNFIDAGCGNGWVVRKVNSSPLCKKACGVDGAQSMIENARAIDPAGEYHLADLLTWNPKNKAEIIFSMEVFYYFENPYILTKHIVDNWMTDGGTLIIGLDHYIGNPDSYSWSEDLNVHMTLKDEQDWIQIFKNAGLSNCESFKVNVSDKFAGTLVIKGDLNH